MIQGPSQRIVDCNQRARRGLISLQLHPSQRGTMQDVKVKSLIQYLLVEKFDPQEGFGEIK